MELAQWFGFIIGLMIAFFMAYWMYSDASQRGARAIVWGVFGLVLPFLALILWLIVRPKEAKG